MIDFPPRLVAFEEGAPVTPDTRSPSRFLFWFMGVQRRVMIAQSAMGLFWFLPPALSPYVIGRAIDDGVLRSDPVATVGWAALLFVMIGIGTAAGIVWHTLAVRGWLVALYGIVELVARKATQLGHVLVRRTPTGEVLSVSSGDSDTFGAVFETVTRTVSAFVAFGVVVALMMQTSTPLGLVVITAVPVLVGTSTLLLKPLHGAQQLERKRSSDLTSQATDIVAGLRILRGIGGEATFGANYATQSRLTRDAGVASGTWRAGVQGLSVLFAGLLLVLLTWQGVHEMGAGRVTIGQLISFFGYAVFLVWPIQTFFEMAQRWVQGLVAARKTIALLSVRSPWPDAAAPAAASGHGDLTDHVSGLTVKAGLLTALVSSVPDDTAALADRLGRYLPTTSEPPKDVSGEELRGREAKVERNRRMGQRQQMAEADAAAASARWGVSLAGVDLADLPLDEIRRHILVSDASSMLFQGTLQQNVDPHGTATREAAERALRVACAEDVYDSLPEGWQGQIDEKGRGLSGGQRQRIVLARAILANSSVLVLVEPTSAVDAHTEARIAASLAAHRRGRTTVVTSASPLLLHHADEVALIEDGVVVATGSHHQLLSDPRYRSVVARGMSESELGVGRDPR